MSVHIKTLGGLLQVLDEVINNLCLHFELMFEYRSKETNWNETSLVTVEGIEFLAHSDNNMEDFDAPGVSEIWSREAKKR
jgi:hypothetical protein